jgi:hypothetical protein
MRRVGKALLLGRQISLSSSQIEHEQLHFTVNVKIFACHTPLSVRGFPPFFSFFIT